MVAGANLDLSAVASVVADVMREDGYQPNAAIAAARIATIALSDLGVPEARPVACQMDAFSLAAVRMLESAKARGLSPGQLPVAEQERWAQDGAVWVSLVNESPGPDSADTW
jgi:hypothetical protein